MTREEFAATRFDKKTAVRHTDGNTYAVREVDFEEDLLCLAHYYGKDGHKWVRCESVELFSVTKL